MRRSQKMPDRSVSQELQRFAQAHDLPSPHVVDDSRGCHAFLYSLDQTKRYAYSLTWAQGQDHLLWVMFNPGTGETEGRRRNTFERCRQWSLSMGYGGMIFANVFALRSKSAKELLKRHHTHDALNEHALKFLSTLAPETIVAWGNHGAQSNQSNSLHGVLSNPKCFGYTKTGQPRHPLYVAKSTPLVAWQGMTAAPCDAS
jgi:hypothetical protein